VPPVITHNYNNNDKESMLPTANDRWPKTMSVCAKGMQTKIKKSFKFASKNTSVLGGFEVGGQLIPDAWSGNRDGAFTKFESG